MPIPVAAAIELSDDERACLEAWTRRTTSAQGLARRARIVLGAADGRSNTEIAERVGVSRPTVAKWRSRFAGRRLDGLVDEPRPGRPRTITDDQVEEVVVKTLETTPKDATHWSTRSMAAEAGLTQNAILRIWQAFGLQPHRCETFKLSKDPLSRAHRASQQPQQSRLQVAIEPVRLVQPRRASRSSRLGVPISNAR